MSPKPLAFSVIFSVGCATVQPPSLLLGRPVEVRTSDETQPSIKGELIAVDESQVVVVGPSGPRTLATADVASVRYKRHCADTKMGLAWALLGGVVTGGALTVSCGGFGSGRCGNVGAATLGIWLLFGGLAAATMDSSASTILRDPSVEQLRPYARFPQGLPPGLELDELTPPPLRARRGDTLDAPKP